MGEVTHIADVPFSKTDDHVMHAAQAAGRAAKSNRPMCTFVHHKKWARPPWLAALPRESVNEMPYIPAPPLRRDRPSLRPTIPTIRMAKAEKPNIPQLAEGPNASVCSSAISPV